MLIVGLVMVAVGIGLVIAAVPSVLSLDDELSTAYGLAIGGGGALAVGLGLVRLTFRSLLQFIVLLSGFALVVGGIELLIFSIPLSRMSGSEIDVDRARTALPAAGGILVAVGGTMALFAVVRWLRNPESLRRWPDITRWSAIAYGGLLLLASSGVAGTITTAAAGADRAPTVQDAAVIGAAVPLGLLPGAVIGLHGLTMAGRRARGPFRFPPASWLLALFALAVGLGTVIVAVEEPLVWLMPLAYAAAAMLPAAVLISVASRGGVRRPRPLEGLSHRQLWVALALGIAAITAVAGLVDGLLAQALSTALLASSGAFDGLRTFDQVTDAFRFPDFYLSKGQTIVLVVIVAAVAAPIVEEGLKGLGVALVLPRRPSPAVALTLGVAVGAGFGVTEASLYGLASLEPDSAMDWWALMLLRAGATSMHALNTGMLGLALYYGRAERRYRQAFLLYLVAVAMHGLWNTMALLAGSRIIFSLENLTDRDLAIVAFAVMSPLALASVTALYVVARRTYRTSPKVGDRAPALLTPATAPAFEPWLG